MGAKLSRIDDDTVINLIYIMLMVMSIEYRIKIS